METEQRWCHDMYAALLACGPYPDWFNRYLLVRGRAEDNWDDIRYSSVRSTEERGSILDRTADNETGAALDRLRTTNIRANESIDNLMLSLAQHRLAVHGPWCGWIEGSPTPDIGANQLEPYQQHWRPRGPSWEDWLHE